MHSISNEQTRGKRIAVRRDTRLCKRVWDANIRLFLLRCSKQTKSLSKIKVYDYRENDKGHPDEVLTRRAEGVHVAQLREGTERCYSGIQSKELRRDLRMEIQCPHW